MRLRPTIDPADLDRDTVLPLGARSGSVRITMTRSTAQETLGAACSALTILGQQQRKALRLGRQAEAQAATEALHSLQRMVTYLHIAIGSSPDGTLDTTAPIAPIAQEAA